MADYNVFKKGDNWVAKRPDATRASAVTTTQQHAYEAARSFASRSDGGEISVHGLNGQVRNKNTISPANDPRSTKG